MELQNWQFSVANPSPYERRDYVEVDIDQLGVDSSLNESSLRLFRLDSDGHRQEIPYQIDRVLGSELPKRILTLLATALPAGSDDGYRASSATFLLEEGKPQEFISAAQTADVWIGHYYDKPRPEEPDDGFSKTWTAGRSTRGVKLCNARLEIYFSLVPHPGPWTGVNYAGSATSVFLTDAEGDMLNPFQNLPEKHWGQLTDLVFFPLPWEVRWFD